MKRKLIKYFFAVFAGFSLLASNAQALSLVPESGKATGKYGLNDFIQIGLNITKIILGLAGSLALLFFIYGGITLLISAGNSSQVEKGKTILINSIIGLAIIFLSWTIINLVMTSLGYSFNSGTWNTTPQ